MPNSIAGLPVDQLDTPAMLIDLDAMDRNIAHIAQLARENGVQWRPHAKGHKSPTVAHRQIAAGAIGVTCAKLGEAEVFAQCGVKDILIASQVVGSASVRRLVALNRQARVMAAVDAPTHVQALAALGAVKAACREVAGAVPGRKQATGGHLEARSHRHGCIGGLDRADVRQVSGRGKLHDPGLVAGGGLVPGDGDPSLGIDPDMDLGSCAPRAPGEGGEGVGKVVSVTGEDRH